MDSPTRWAIFFSSATCSLQKVHFLKCKTLEVGFSRQFSILFFLSFSSFFFSAHGCLKGLCSSCQVHCLNFLSPLWNLTLVKKLLVINKITAPSPGNMPPKHYIKRNNKNELWKTVWLTSFHKPQLESVSIFFKFVHPNLLLYFFLCLLFNLVVVATV